MPMCAEWNNRLREAWQKSGLQQKDLAFRARVPQATVSRMLSPDDENESKLSSVLPVIAALKLRVSEVFDDSAPLPASRLTPYDVNPLYRKLIDTVHKMAEQDRSMLLSVVDWLASHATARMTDNVLEFVPAKMPEVPKEMTEDELRSIANALGDVVEFRKGALWKEYEVPLVATVSAGKGIEIFETYEKVRQIPEYYWKAGARAVFKVRGHSMLDMGITDNDLLFVKPTAKPRNGEIVVCSLNGAAFVKEFERTKDGVRLISHSTSFEPMPVTENDDLRVFGVVLGRTGDLTGERKKK